MPKNATGSSSALRLRLCSVRGCGPAVRTSCRSSRSQRASAPKASACMKGRLCSTSEHVSERPMQRAASRQPVVCSYVENIRTTAVQPGSPRQGQEQLCIRQAQAAADRAADRGGRTVALWQHRRSNINPAQPRAGAWDYCQQQLHCQDVLQPWPRQQARLQPCGQLQQQHLAPPSHYRQLQLQLASETGNQADRPAGGKPSPHVSSSGQRSTGAASEPGPPEDSSKKASGQEAVGSSSSSSSKPASGASVEDEVDQILDKLWGDMKQGLKKELGPEQASMVDKWSASDIQTDKIFREIANQQLGPFLQSLGIEQDPFDFFLDLCRIALLFQLAAAGVVFYTVELGLGGNAGDGLRAVGGLMLGYSLRLGIKVEQLAWPVYNELVQLLLSDGATYEIPPATAEEQRETLNKLGVALAVAFLVPKFVFGWHNDECWQLVVPMLGGLFGFDIAYLFALLIKLGMGGGDGEDKE